MFRRVSSPCCARLMAGVVPTFEVYGTVVRSVNITSHDRTPKLLPIGNLGKDGSTRDCRARYVAALA